MPKMKRALPGPWADQALCTDDPELFFPDEDHPTFAQAQAICRRCPVQVECLTHAQLYLETWGVWGGLTAAERKLARDQNMSPEEAIALHNTPAMRKEHARKRRRSKPRLMLIEIP
jgi:hypothetical protein